MARQSLAASPPGKSQRAVPESGMNSVAWTKAASPTTTVMEASVCPGECITRASSSPIWKVSPSAKILSHCEPSVGKSAGRL